MGGWRRLLPLLHRHIPARSFGFRNAVPIPSSTSVARHISSLSHKEWIIDPSVGGYWFWGALPYAQRLQQKLGISTLRAPLLSPAGGNEQPVRSPLTMVPGLGKGTSKQEGDKRHAQAVLKKIKQSPKKVNLVATLVRGMRVEDALLQLQVTTKRAAKTVGRVIASARANASHNHGLDADRLFVAEAFVGKGKYLKRISYHAKGRSGVMHHPSCRLTVIVQEMSPEQEAELARYRTMNFRERARFKSKLVPHRLIETSWKWHRKPKEISSSMEVSESL